MKELEPNLFKDYPSALPPLFDLAKTEIVYVLSLAVFHDNFSKKTLHIYFRI